MGFANWLAGRENGAESGAVTVDWVVLTAAIVVVGASVVTVIAPGIDSAGDHIYSGILAATDN